MYCCSNCFLDIEIKAIIEGQNLTGNCDFCQNTNAECYDLDQDSILGEMFDRVLDVYTPLVDLPESFPADETELLGILLVKNWHLFNLDAECTSLLIREMCSDRYKEQPELFEKPVGIRQSQDISYIKENSILKENKWESFVNSIKTENRFHSDHMNTSVLHLFLRCLEQTYTRGERLYRARISPDGKGFPIEEMGPPPGPNIKGGRVNPTGISILYLSDSYETTFYEIRAGIYDFISVGTFQLERNIKVINLTHIDLISPFVGMNYGFDLTQYAINFEHLSKIADEIAKPLRNDNELDYLPTQYICDFIRSKGYDGIEYKSTIRNDGLNLAVFKPDVFRCQKINVYDIKAIHYTHDFARI